MAFNKIYIIIFDLKSMVVNHNPINKASLLLHINLYIFTAFIDIFKFVGNEWLIFVGSWTITSMQETVTRGLRHRETLTLEPRNESSHLKTEVSSALIMQQRIWQPFVLKKHSEKSIIHGFRFKFTHLKLIYRPGCIPRTAKD